MAYVLGLNAKMYRETSTDDTTYVEMDNIRDVSLSLTKATADVTVRGGDGWRQTVSTLKEGSVSFSMVYDTGDADFTAVKDAFMNNSDVRLKILDGVDPPAAGKTVQGLKSFFTVSDFSINENLEEAMTVDVTVQTTYSATAPAWYSVTTPE